MNQITIYTTPVCVFCKMVKQFFADNEISYVEKDVAADGEARDKMVEISGQMGVPVIVIDDNVIVGFNKPRLEELLGLK